MWVQEVGEPAYSAMRSSLPLELLLMFPSWKMIAQKSLRRLWLAPYVSLTGRKLERRSVGLFHFLREKKRLSDQFIVLAVRLEASGSMNSTEVVTSGVESDVVSATVASFTQKELASISYSVTLIRSFMTGFAFHCASVSSSAFVFQNVFHFMYFIQWQQLSDKFFQHYY